MVLFLGGLVALVLTGSPLWLIAVFSAALPGAASMFAAPPPSAEDLPHIDEQLGRFRGAMFVCFAGAALAVVGRSASLGVALWLVAFVLLFFVMYYRRLLSSRA